MKKKKERRSWKQQPAISEEETENSSDAEIPNSFGNDGDRSNLLWQPDTNAAEKVLGGVELGGGGDFIINDIVDVVGEECLHLGEEQVQMVEF